MDTVVSLNKHVDGSGIRMDFRKARLRKPKTSDQFKARMIERKEDGWVEIAGVEAKSKSERTDIFNIKVAMVQTYDMLADGLPTSPGLDGALVRKLPVEKLRDELKSHGLLETNDTGGLTAAARKQFQRAKASLLSGSKPRLIEREGLIWKCRRPTAMA
jgi:hypothetical protein